jgi:hypothetical protein
VSNDTGRKFDDGKPPLGMIPRAGLEEIALVLGHGARKYGRDNWRHGLRWSRLYDALLRHVRAFIDGEDMDQESGYTHLAHAGCNIFFLLEYMRKGLGIDDRPGSEGEDGATRNDIRGTPLDLDTGGTQ